MDTKKTVFKNSEKNKELEARITEISNNWKRALADYQNLERRTQEEKNSFTKYAKASLIEKLLPVVDILNKVKLHINDQGLELAIKTLNDVLKAEGLIKIEATEQPFDPFKMHAISLVTGKEEGKVVEVYQDGYLFFDKVIRPAQVKVGAGKKSIKVAPVERLSASWRKRLNGGFKKD